MGVEQRRNDYKLEAVLAEVMSKLARHQYKSDEERLIGIDANTGEVLYDAIGGRWGIDATRDFGNDPKPLGSKWKEKLGGGDLSIIDIHTHSDDTCFSADDWESFATRVVVESRLITDDAIYSIRKSSPLKKSPTQVREEYKKTALKLAKTKPKATEKERTVEASRTVANELGVSFKASER